jgi:hypothetical protein
VLYLHVFEGLFDYTIFKAMKGNDRHTSSRGETRKSLCQAVAQCPQFVVHRYTQRLKCPRRWMDMAAAPGYGLFDYSHEFSCCLDRLPGSGTYNGTGNAPRPTLLTIGKKEVGKGGFTPSVDNLSGSQFTRTLSAMQCHYQRFVSLEAKTSTGAFELVGAHPKVKEYFRHLCYPQVVKHQIQVAKIRLHQSRLTRALLEPFCRAAQGVRIFVQTDASASRSQALADCCAVPAATHRTIQDNVVWYNRQPIHKLG